MMMHLALSAHRYIYLATAAHQVLGVGAFNAWRYKQPSLYFFDVGTDPARPKFIKSITPSQGAVADDFIRLPNGGFVISLMGNTNGEQAATLFGSDGCKSPLTVQGGTVV